LPRVLVARVRADILDGRETIDVPLSLLVHDASAVGRALDCVRPASDPDIRSGHLSNVGGRRIGTGVEGPPAASRPRDESIEQRSTAQDERDAELARGRKKAPEDRMKRGVHDELVARKRFERLQHEHPLSVRHGAGDDVGLLEASPFHRRARSGHGVELVGVDHLTAPPSRSRLAAKKLDVRSSARWAGPARATEALRKPPWQPRHREPCNGA
jgi:hypothetical protein